MIKVVLIKFETTRKSLKRKLNREDNDLFALYKSLVETMEDGLLLFLEENLKHLAIKYGAKKTFIDQGINEFLLKTHILGKDKISGNNYLYILGKRNASKILNVFYALERFKKTRRLNYIKNFS